MKANLKKLPKLFLSSFLISAVTFGGGYVIVTFFKKKYVDEYKWIDEKEMLDLIAIAQASPGAIAVNGAIITGYKICGVLGAAVAVLATILPPFIIIAAVSAAYNAFKDNRVLACIAIGICKALWQRRRKKNDLS